MHRLHEFLDWMLHRGSRRLTILLFVVQMFLLVLVLSRSLAENWIFVAFYALGAFYAAWCRLPLLALMGISLVVLRSLIAAGIGGWPFEIASVAFAAMYFIVIVEAATILRRE